MMKTGTMRMMAVAAIAPMLLATVPAQAGTRASDGAAGYSAAASGQPGLQRAAPGEDDANALFAFDLKTILLGAAALALLIAITVDGGNSRPVFQSNGAN